MDNIIEKEDRMYSLLSKISKNSTKNYKRIYLKGDPVVDICNDYYKELFDAECFEVQQEGTQFIPHLRKTIRYKEVSRVIDLNIVLDKELKFTQQEFNFN